MHFTTSALRRSAIAIAAIAAGALCAFVAQSFALGPVTGAVLASVASVLAFILLSRAGPGPGRAPCSTWSAARSTRS
jgi:hypothetical protein